MIEAGAPCLYCGVRPDVACKHRPAVERPAPGLGETAPSITPARPLDKLTPRPSRAKKDWPETENDLLAILAGGPCWLRSLGHMKPIYRGMIERGLAQRCPPREGMANNMLQLVNKGVDTQTARG